MTALPVPIEQAADKRAFPKCPFCGWRPAMKLYPAGMTLLKDLVDLAALAGRAMTRHQLMTPISDYKCPKCKQFVVVHVGDLLRN